MKPGDGGFLAPNSGLLVGATAKLMNMSRKIATKSILYVALLS